MRTLLSVLVATLALFVTSCGGSDDASSQPKSGDVSSTPSESPSETAVAPNTGDKALKVGETRVGSGADTTVFEIKSPVKGPSFAEPDTATNVWATARVKQCVHDDWAEEHLQTSSYDFLLLDAGGGEYETASSSWDGWPPLPKYPVERTLAPGRCAAGWILFEAPDGVQITGAALSAGDGTFAAEWRR